MRLESLLDPLYLIGAVWGGPGTQVCVSNDNAARRSSYEAARAAEVRVVDTVVAFVGVNVVPMDAERVLVNQTVVVQDGWITALGPAATTAVPTRAIRIDGQGLYLMPGLTDMHYHPQFGHSLRKNELHKIADSLFNDLASGITGTRYITGVDSAVLAMLEDGVPGPRAYHGPGTPKSAKRDSLGIPRVTPTGVVAHVVEAKAAGHHFIEFSDNISLLNLELEPRSASDSAAFDSLVVASRRFRIPLASHDHTPIPARVPLIGPAGGSIEHVASLLEALGYPVSKSWDLIAKLQRVDTLPVSSEQIRALAMSLRQAGVWVTPTLQCSESKSGPTLLGPGVVKLMRQLVKAMQEAGVGLLLAGDDGQNVRDELAALVRAGLTPYQALRAGTFNPAQYFGILDSAGTVAAGKRADLVLLYGNPLADVRHVREPAGVMVDGRWFDRATLDRGLLASPQYWWRLIQTPPYPGLSEEQKQRLHTALPRLEALDDSLAAAAPSASQGLRRRIADELGAVRGLLTPEQRLMFDPLARVWLREQARQGHAVTVPGLARVP